MDPSTELANLEKDNATRIDALIGQGVQLQPGTFELIQITVYLEQLLGRQSGELVGDTFISALDMAKLAFAERCAEVITQLEQAARRAKIVNGRFPNQGHEGIPGA